MKSKKTVLAASYPSRIFKNDVTIKCPDCMVLCSGGCLTVAANSKNKETTTSLFFSRRQRSKVIFRVTQNSLRILLTSYRNHLALAGSSAPISLLTMVARLMELWSKPSLYLPMVAFVSACPSVKIYSNVTFLNNGCYGKEKGQKLKKR